jgi:hypothetical protein
MEERERRGEMAYLVYHIGQQALRLVRINRVHATPHTNSSMKLRDRHARPPYRLGLFLLGLLEPARDEHLAQEVAQGNVAPPLEGQVYPSLDELVLAVLEGDVEGVQVALADAFCEGQEELLQSGVRLQEGFGGEDVAGEEAAGDEVYEDASGGVCQPAGDMRRVSELFKRVGRTLNFAASLSSTASTLR